MKILGFCSMFGLTHRMKETFAVLGLGLGLGLGFGLGLGLDF